MKNLPFNLHRLALAVVLLIASAALPLVQPVSAAPGNLGPSGVVNTGRLNVRTGPYITYSIVIMIEKGQGFSLIGRNTPATWVQIRLPSGTTGWVNAFYVLTNVSVGSLPITGDASAAATSPIQSVALGLVVTGRLNVRAGPDPFAQILTIVDKGSVIDLIGRNVSGTWAQGVTAGGVTGWVKVAFMRLNISIFSLQITGP